MMGRRASQSGALLQQIGRLFLEGSSIGLSEGELLDRFVRGRDEAAFEALVARHGPMVLSVCRQLLRDPNDVDDAFQATFLVLVRKAGTLRRCDLLGNWLYGVAYRVAFRARSLSARRMARFGSLPAVESLADGNDGGISAPSSDTATELERRPWLHHEVSHLPEKYRAPVVLCYFEGLTHDQAASRLGCPPGTVKGRLSRARSLLRRRLTRRGVALSAAAITSQLSLSDAQAAVPAALELATTRSASSFASSAGISLARLWSISIPVTNLAEGVLQTMMWNQIRLTAASLLLASTVATGMVIGATQLGGGSGGGGETRAAREDSGGAGSQRDAFKSKKAAVATEEPKQSINPDLAFEISETSRAFDHMLSRLRDPSVEDVDRLSNWSSFVLEAESALGSTLEDTVAARTAHRDRMKKLHELLKKLPASAKNQTVNANYAEKKLRLAQSVLDSPDGIAYAEMMGQMGSGMQPQGMGGMAGGMQGQMRSMMGGGMAGMMGRGGRGGMGGGGMVGMGGMMGPAAQRKGVDVRQTRRAENSDQAGAAGADSGAAGRQMGGGGAGGFGGDAGDGGRDRTIFLSLAESATELAIRDKNPKSKAVHQKLDEPISMAFPEETALEDVIKYIKQATTTKTYSGIPIYVDPHGLEEAEKNMTSTLRNMELEGIPLKTTLRLALRQLRLAYCVRDGVLIISTPEGILDELLEAQKELEMARTINPD